MSNGMTGPGVPDFTRPSVARVHDVLLGEHDNFAPDRALAARLTEICPALPALVPARTAISSSGPSPGRPDKGSASSPTSAPGCPGGPASATRPAT